MQEQIIFYAGFAVAVWLFLIGLYGIISSRHLVHLCLSLTVVQASTYVLLAVIGYRPGLPAPVFIEMPATAPAVDPVIQALMLTDIVVEATVIALLLSITVRIHRKAGSADPNEVDLMRG
ncbi:MAG TPA: cation:proton antiporter subunit C [Candidatus Acidoferrales bacterium]|nr:cation:proton antiporter subunit C [Candidatus Acidoferrales bacterium]